MRARWVLLCALGEALGIGLVAMAYAAGDRGLTTTPGLLVLAAGSWEGLALGSAQASLLARFGIRPARWIAATLAAAFLGYAGTLAGGAGQGGADAAEPGLALILAAGAALGLVMGVVMGLVQGLAGRPHLALARWVILNALGWAGAMAIIMFAATAAPGSWPLPAIGLLGALAGGLAGAALGLVTRFGLPLTADSARA